MFEKHFYYFDMTLGRCSVDRGPATVVGLVDICTIFDEDHDKG
jgi:hypothetical protein